MSDMVFTQEQLDALVAERISEAKKGLLTEEEFNKRVTSEVDRRVESGIQKGLETQKQKWEREFSERAKLSVEELAQKEIEEKMKELGGKEAEIARKANMLEAKSMLADASIPKSQYEKFVDMLVSDDVETTKANVENFITMIKSTQTEIETKVKSEVTKIPKPNTGGSETITKADFIKMSYADKLKLKNENFELYNTFMK